MYNNGQKVQVDQNPTQGFKYPIKEGYTQSSKKKKDKKILEYVGIGVGALVVVALIVYGVRHFMKKGSRGGVQKFGFRFY